MGEANCERSHHKKRHHDKSSAAATTAAATAPMNREQLRQLVLAIDGSNQGSESEPEESANTGPSSRATSSPADLRHHHHPIRTLIPGLTIEPTNLVISTLEAHRNKRAAAAQVSRSSSNNNNNNNNNINNNRQQSVSPNSPTGDDDQPLNLSMDVHVVDLSTKQKAKEKENSLARPRPVYAQQADPISQYLTRIESLVTSQYLPNSLAFAQHPIVPTSPSLAAHPAIAGFNLFPFGAAGINPFALQSPESISAGPASPADLPGSGISRRSSYDDAYSGSEKDLKVKRDASPVKHKKLKTSASSTATSPNASSRKGDGYQKPKQRRYRTERPYVCPHCSARFTLRSNMERHGKHQHPQVWQRSPSNRIINRQKNGQLNSLAGLPTLVPAATKFMNGNLQDVSEKAVDAPPATNLSVKAVIAQQLKRKLSSGSLRNNNNGSETETDTENSATGDVKMETAEASPDLASVSQLLDRVNKSSNLAQFFGPLNLTTAPAANNNNNNNNNNASNDEENNSEDQGDAEDSAEDPVSSEEGDTKPTTGEKKKSAYSSAPHKISCPHCTRRFPWTSSLRRHLLTHTGQKPFQCSKCPLLFTTKSNCDRHLARKHGGGRSKVVSDSNNTSEDEEGQEPGLEEDQGDTGAEDSEAKSSASPAPPTKVAKVPTTTPPTSTPKPPVVPANGATSTTSSPGEDAAFRCHLCEAAAGEREALLTHMEEQHKDTFHLLVSKGALSSSPPSETSETEHLIGDQKDATHRKVMCVFCVRRFWSVEDLRRHIRSHSGERPFSCPHCLRRFTLKHSMLRHLKKHSASSTPSRKLRRIVSKNLASPTSSGSEQIGDRGKDGDLISRLLGLDDGTLVEKLLNQPDATDAANILGITSQQQQQQQQQNFNSSRKSSKVM